MAERATPLKIALGENARTVAQAVHKRGMPFDRTLQAFVISL